MITIICTFIACLFGVIILESWNRLKYKMWIEPILFEAVIIATKAFIEGVAQFTNAMIEMSKAGNKVIDAMSKFPSGGISSRRTDPTEPERIIPIKRGQP